MQRTGIIVGAALVIGAIALVVAGTAAQDGEYDRLYQVSTIDALLQGVYDGTVTSAALEREGDTGIGTFDHLDGELTMLDGETWQARADGSVSRAPQDETTPFAGVARYRADRTGALGAAANFNETGRRLDTYLSSTNLFALVRADGSFEYDPSASAALRTALTTSASTTDSFEYEIDDQHGGKAKATVTIRVTGPRPSGYDYTTIATTETPATYQGRNSQRRRSATSARSGSACTGSPSAPWSGARRCHPKRSSIASSRTCSTTSKRRRSRSTTGRARTPDRGVIDAAIASCKNLQCNKQQCRCR
jgi:alpha-acetolactate decarboxylase